MKVRLMYWRGERCGVPRKDKCRNSDVRERCDLKEDVVTRAERGGIFEGKGGVSCSRKSTLGMHSHATHIKGKTAGANE
ncbi:hypothetical protein EVAR_62007_1 [Eumeta japonica]|uniref:Uncharacterized protein n=1 Tax=Eumeta variegata TaxID=151549 RepID=A0A4C1ZTP7_EUMVA|nr:hypothetical protein EVAR_62007_1 [Eumeta japonica]